MPSAPVKDDPQNVFGWCMYDWANSAYSTTVLSGLLPTYFAAVVIGPEGTEIAGYRTSATALWGLIIGFSSFLAFIAAPVLGAIADFSAAKKRFLLTFAFIGASFTALLFLCGPGDVYLTLGIFLIAQVSFVGANVFYDAFLPEVSSDEKMDWTSGKGYSYGYVGGGTQFALSLVLVAGHESLGISQSTAAQLGILMAGLWWGGFTLITAKYLKEQHRPAEMPAHYQGWPRMAAYIGIGVSRTIATTRRVGRFKHLVLFLVAFMLYNDGIQTVIEMATIYGTEELGLSTTTLMITLLVIQVVAVFGALAFGWLSQRIGAKRAIMLSLVIWSGVVIYAYFITTAAEYFALGVAVGLVLGGSQALSRSFYGSMVPREAAAEFFGFYTVFSKFSAIWGPLTFAVVRQWAGSSRLAILSLLVFFVAGLVLLALMDETKARKARIEHAF